MPKAKIPASRRTPPASAVRMTTAEAAVAALIAHGLDTIYALPGVHNDHLFDALFKAGDRLRTVHARHEQGAAYMALGAALATGKPQAYTVVPGPGLLNSAAALLTAYGMNAPVLGLIGQIPQSAIGHGLGHLHEIRDQAGIISRLVDFSARIRAPGEAAGLVAAAILAMGSGRPGPAVLECAMDVWGRSAPMVAPPAPLPQPEPLIDEDAIARAAERLSAAKRPLIVAGGGAQGASAEVTELSRLLQAPVLAYRRGRGVLDGRDPFSVTLPLGRELWGEADVVLGVGTRLFYGFTQWGLDKELAIIRIDADPEEPERFASPAVALVGDAQPILQRLIAAMPAQRRSSRQAEMIERQAGMRRRLDKLAPQIGFLEAIRAELPEDGIFVDEVTQMGFAARLLLPVYRRARSCPPAIRTISAGATRPRSAPSTRDRMYRCSRSRATAAFCSPPTRSPPRCATASHSPWWSSTTAPSAMSGASRRSITATASSPATSPIRISCATRTVSAAAAERARSPAELRAALARAFKRRDGPTLIEVPVGPMPSPWEFIHMPPVRGAK